MSRMTLAQRQERPAAGPQTRGGHGHVRATVPLGPAADFSRVPVSPLPYRDAIQQSFGRHDVSSLHAHTGPDAAARAEVLGAKAFTVGHDVSFGERPTLFTAAHEAAHAIQQRSGVALPGNTGTPGDRHERHADEVASRVVAGRSSEGLLDAYASRAGSPRAGLQLLPQSTHYGRFIDTTYKKLDNGLGVEMLLHFEPNDKANATKIGLVQSIKSSVAGTPIITDPSQESRLVGSGAGAGYRIDRVTPQNNPIYGSPALAPGEDLDKTAPTNAPAGKTPTKDNASYELGHRFDLAGASKEKNAWLHDKPERPARNDTELIFETTALAIEGVHKGTYYGSVKWGFQRNSAGVLAEVPFVGVSQGVPSQNFLAPAAAFNAAKTRGTLIARHDPTQVYKVTASGFDPDFTIAKGTTVSSSGTVGAGPNSIPYAVITVSGTSPVKSGYIKVADIQDKGDGKATVDLPVPEVQIINTIGGVVLNDRVPPYPVGPRLSNGTRVTATGVTQPSPDGKTLTWVAVVDGPNIGAAGYVPATVLLKERR